MTGELPADVFQSLSKMLQLSVHLSLEPESPRGAPRVDVMKPLGAEATVQVKRNKQDVEAAQLQETLKNAPRLYVPYFSLFR